MQRSFKGADLDTVDNMDADAFLDSIIKRFTIIYGSVKSLALLMIFKEQIKKMKNLLHPLLVE